MFKFFRPGPVRAGTTRSMVSTLWVLGLTTSVVGLVVGPTVPTDRVEWVGPQTAAAATDSGPSGRCVTRWVAPVTAPVTDGWRPPSGPFGPGNRGLEYGTEAGDPVRAVADGVVRFAGPVGRHRFVTVEHRSGLRSTYAYLQTVLVEVGGVVVAGQLVAEAEPGFHLTARLADRYRDPTPLLAPVCYRTRLVPVPGDR